MSTNIALLVIVGVASAIILMFGDFEGKVIRTVTTLILFAVFTAFAAYDSTRNAPPRYMVISQIGHMYMLLLSLILIWGSLLKKYGYFSDFNILFKTILIVVLVKTAILALQQISNYMYAPQHQLSLVAKFCVGLFTLTTAFFSMPIATDYFVKYNDFYWKLSVTVLIFTALALSVTLLLAWYFKNGTSDKHAHALNDAARNTAASTSIRNAPQHGSQGPRSFQATPSEPVHMLPSEPQQGVQQQPVVAAPASPPSYAPNHAVSDPLAKLPTEYARPVAGPQPWPVFPNGQPLPAGQNGRPDFAVLQYVASVHAEAERQWFSS